MRDVLYTFESFGELAIEMEAGGDEQELDLREEHRGLGLKASEWVLATFAIYEDAISVAACAADRGLGLHLAFEDRDWQQLWQFANSDGPPSAPPPSVAGNPISNVQAPPGAVVLVVDDEQNIQHVVSEVLRKDGFSVVGAFSAEEAFDQVRDGVPDLIVLDWNLPGMTGIDFCRRLRRERNTARLPIMFLTSNSSSEHLVEAFEAGADDFVAKPFRAPELGARVMGLLRRASLRPPSIPPRTP